MRAQPRLDVGELTARAARPSDARRSKSRACRANAQRARPIAPERPQRLRQRALGIGAIVAGLVAVLQRQARATAAPAPASARPRATYAAPRPVSAYSVSSSWRPSMLVGVGERALEPADRLVERGRLRAASSRSCSAPSTMRRIGVADAREEVAQAGHRGRGVALLPGVERDVLLDAERGVAVGAEQTRERVANLLVQRSSPRRSGWSLPSTDAS